jgi:hypothetical protein
MAPTEEPNETTALLSGTQDEIDNASADSKRRDHEAALRRRSSTTLPPFHEDFPPSETPSSSLAIYVVIPISLIGEYTHNTHVPLI